jgi:hypothetical protein
MKVLLVIKEITNTNKLKAKILLTIKILPMEIKTFRFLISYLLLLAIKVSWVSKKTKIKLKIILAQQEIPNSKISPKLNIIIRKLFIQLMIGKIINKQLNRIQKFWEEEG